MGYYRKKQPLVKAMQWRGDNADVIKALSENIYGPFGNEGENWLEIETLERGRIIVNLKDYVIFYVDSLQIDSCNDEDFHMNYEPINQPKKGIIEEI